MKNLVSENIDRIMTIDFPRRGVIDTIYPLARKRNGGPLAMEAAELLDVRVKRGDIVLIATGWLDRPHVSLEVAETDGPPGAAALARSVHLGLGAVPVLLVEEELVVHMTRLMHAVGLRVLSVDEACAAEQSTAALHACAVVALPKDWHEAEALTQRYIESYSVGAFIAIEKGGANAYGEIHTSRGANTTSALGKGDAVRAACSQAGVVTIGIGDGGNEIGMGSIADDLKGVLRYGERCACACGGGTVPAGATDTLVAATVSNWGAYAVAACLAFLKQDPSLAHSPEREERVLLTCTQVGLIDGVSGLVEPTADGLSLETQLAFVTLLRTAIGTGVMTQGWDRERNVASLATGSGDNE